MPFKIAPYPGQTYPPPYARHDDIRAYLGFGELVQREIAVGFGQPAQHYHTIQARKLPTDFWACDVWVPLLDGRSTLLQVREGHKSADGRRGKSSAHRCHVACPDCGLLVPAGRTHQHKCS